MIFIAHTRWFKDGKSRRRIACAGHRSAPLAAWRAKGKRRVRHAVVATALRVRA
ncbi:hypothetical protein GCM10009115_09970 [Sphingopyxis soli]|uniref:Uncharacterized protein n=1 Tax=Sphingopyxis soli TaxID=592051 RepID=A0ABP3XC14_9SPHN